MKINIEVLKKFEKDNKNRPFLMDSVRIMINSVLLHKDTPFNLAPTNIKVSIETLKSMGILEGDNSKEIQQLNS